MDQLRVGLLGLFALVAAVSCSSSNESGADPSGGDDNTQPVSEELHAACQLVADTWCRRLEECSPLDLERFYATPAICQAAALDECEKRLALDAVSQDPKGPRNIAAKLESTACSVIVAATWTPQYTDQPGSRAIGAACRLGIQCDSLYCQTSPGADCGTCAVQPNLEEHENEPCWSDGAGAATVYGCGVPGLVCQDSTRVCLLPRVGDPCIQPESSGYSDSQRCGNELECHEGTCIEPRGFGESCTATDDRCMRRAGLACNEQSVCAVADRGPAHVQGKCGGLPENGGGSCGYDDLCTYADPNGDNDIPGNCVPKPIVGLGDACDTLHPCPYAMSCISGTCQTSPWAASACR